MKRRNEKKALIMPLGRAPAVATEMTRYLLPEGLTDLIIVPTRDNLVIAGARLVESAIKVNYPTIRVHIHTSPVTDVTTEEDTIKTMHTIAKAICAEKFEFNTDTLYLSISGGRKEITVTSTIIGLAFGITKIYHVINKNVKTYNEYQEQIIPDIEKFIEPQLSKRINMYKADKEKFDTLLFPKGDVLEFIRVPTIPYLPQQISLLKRILRREGIFFADEKIDMPILAMLKRAELIMFDDYRVWPTDLGIEIGKMLRCEYR